MQAIQQLLRKVFAPEHLVKDQLKRGEIPGIQEAYKTTAVLALPAVAEMVLISLIGLVNTVMVSNLGAYAIAAVGLTNQPRLLIMCIFMAMNVGVTAIVSRSKGAERPEDANRCLSQALLLVAVLSVVVAAAGAMLAGPIMSLAGALDDTIGPASGYFRIICYAVPFQAASLVISAAQRGIGRTDLTLKINLTANIVNIILNFLLIEGRFGFPRLEVNGSAVAMAVGQACGFVLALTSILRKGSYLTLRGRDKSYWRPHMPMLRNIADIGGSAMLEQLAQRFGFILFARIVADLGTNIFAVHQIAMQILNITFTFGDGLSVASTALVGQSIGRKRPDLSIMYGKIGQRFAFCISGLMFIVIFFLRHQLVGLFSDDPYILYHAANTLILLCFVQYVQTSQVVMAGSLRGAGDTKYVAATMLLTVAICRPGIGFLLAYPAGLGIYGAWIGILVDMSIRLVLLMRRFSGGKWMQIAMSR